MGLRFYRRVKILPGVTMNLSKSGPSFSFGPRGAKVTVGKNGIRQTFGIPGTGIYYTKNSKWNKDNNSRTENSSNNTVSSNPLSNSGVFNDLFASPKEKKFSNAMKLFLSDNYDAAYAEFKQSQEIIDCCFMCGYIALGRGYYAEAERYFKECLNNISELGRYANKIFGENFEIILDVTKFIEVPIKFDKKGLSLALVEAYQGQNKYSRALNILTEMWNENSSDKIILLSLIDLIVYSNNSKQQEIKEIIEITSQVENEDPLDTNILYLRAYGLYRMNLLNGCIEQLSKLTRKKKDRPSDLMNQIFYIRGRMYEKLGQMSKSKKDYEKVYVSDPNYEDVSKRLGL